MSRRRKYIVLNYMDRVLQRNITNREREIDFKELAHVIETGKSKNLQGRPAGWRPRDEMMF